MAAEPSHCVFFFLLDPRRQNTTVKLMEVHEFYSTKLNLLSQSLQAVENN